MATTYINDCL